MLLEIIACSVEDAVAAEKGGATRLELISHFEIGGLTPSLELVRAVLQAVDIPVRVMVRESENFTITSDAEKRRLCEIAGNFATLPLEGIVCGFLQGTVIDHDLLARVMAAAGPLRVTFHRAFEALEAPLLGIQQLKQYPRIDYLLTSGGPGTNGQKIAWLAECYQAGQPELQILAGGGLTEEQAREISLRTPIRAFHWGTAVRIPPKIEGEVSADRVAAVARLLATKT